MRLLRFFFVSLLVLTPALLHAVPDAGWLLPADGATYGRSTAPYPNDLDRSDYSKNEGILVRVEGTGQMSKADFYVGDQKVGASYRSDWTPSGTKVFTGKVFFPTTGTRTLVAKLTDGFVLTTLNGPTIHVTSPGPLAVIGTEAATGLGSASMTLRANYENHASYVNSLYFQYGTTTGYGADTPQLDKHEYLVRPHIVERQVWGLQPDTEYHYRLVVTTAAGTVYGPDMVATTTANLDPVAKMDVGVLRDDGTCIVGPLWNDSDDSIQPFTNLAGLEVVSFSQGSAGLVELSISGEVRFRYTAGPGFTGVDTFTYTLEDPFGAQATGTVEIRSILAHYDAIAGGYVAPLDNGGAPAGTITLQVTRAGAFTGNLNHYGVAHPFSGVFRRSEEGGFECSSREFTFPATGGPRIQFSFYLSYTEDNIPMISGGSGSGPYFDIVHTPQLMPPAEAAPEAGQFTSVLPNPNAEALANTTDQPQGHAFATMRVSRTGRMTVTGRLGDNTAFSAGGRMRRDKNVYMNAVGGATRRARLVGLLEFDHTKSIGGTGTLLWKNAESRKGFYQHAFNLELKAKGEKFTPPARRKPIFDTATGTPAMVNVVVKERNGVTKVNDTLPLGLGNKVDSGRADPSRLRLTLNPRNGLFSGTLTEPGQRTKRLMGVVQTESRTGLGTGGTPGTDVPVEIEVSE